MPRIFEVSDRRGRQVYLTVERWEHIQKHPNMRDKLEEIRQTIMNPAKVTAPRTGVFCLYRHYKRHQSKARYLRVIVKYLNGEAFVITAYFVGAAT